MKEFFKYGQGIGVALDIPDSVFDNEHTFTFDHGLKKGSFNEVMFSVPNDTFGKLHRKNATVDVFVIDANDFVRLSTLLDKGNVMHHITVVVKPNVEVLVVDDFTDSNTNAHFISRYVEIIAMPNSKVTWVKKHKYGNAWVFSRSTAKIMKDATVNVVELVYSGKYVSQRNTNLIYQGGTGTIKSIFLGHDNELYDINTDSVHVEGDSTSDILVKGMLDGNSRTVYRGLINIKPGARNSSGYQKQDTIMLSETARIDSVPNLEIANNDVSCSHGVSVGEVDSEQLFYLMSRGITRKDAQEMIIKGFLFPIIKDLPADLQEELL